MDLNMRTKTLIVLILLISFITLGVINCYGIGTPESTIISNVQDYFGSFVLPNDYITSLPGELTVFFTNDIGKTNVINGKYYYFNGALQTNITTMTVSAGYDLSSIPQNFSGDGTIGAYINYVYLITNKANISDNLTVQILPLGTDDPSWHGNIFSLFVNGSGIVLNQSNIFTTINNVSADEVLNLRIRLAIPQQVVNMSTNLFSFEIWNSIWNTNTSTGDNWPGMGAISPATSDTNDLRDYQISYIKTTAYGHFHTVSVISADDMIHTIYKFDGTEMLGTTRLKINILLDTPPVDKENFYLIYNINKNPTGNRQDDVRVKIEGDGLNYYALIFPQNDPRIRAGSQFNFIIQVDNETYYRDGRNGFNVWSFQLKSIKMQKNNISILRNLLNPRKGERTILFYSLNKPSNVNIDVYTLSGEKIITLFNGYQQSGLQEPIYWDGKNSSGNEVGEGLYFVHFRTEELNEIRKVIVVK